MLGLGDEKIYMSEKVDYSESIEPIKKEMDVRSLFVPSTWKWLSRKIAVSSPLAYALKIIIITTVTVITEEKNKVHNAFEKKMSI